MLTLQVYFDLYLINDSYDDYLFSFFDSFEKWVQREKFSSKAVKKSLLRFIQISRSLAKEYNNVNFNVEKVENILKNIIIPSTFFVLLVRLLNIFFFSWIISPHKEFTKRWRDVIDDKIQAVLSEKALTLITALEQHVQAGCLSAIPPEVGDENFSEIHNTLRKSVSHCRITVPLVSALFSMCLHEVSRYPSMFVVLTTGLEFSRNLF